MFHLAVNYFENMCDKKNDCGAGFKGGAIDSETFERELELCQKLSRENGGSCNWGKCADCGVIPFLIKLHHGILLEKPEEIKKAKDEAFKR